MKSGYKEFEFVKNEFNHEGDCKPINPAQDVLRDLESLQLTEAIIYSKNIDELREVLKNTQYITLNNQIEHWRTVWLSIEEALKISKTTIFHNLFIQKLNQIPQQYGLRAKTAELVFTML